MESQLAALTISLSCLWLFLLDVSAQQVKSDSGNELRELVYNSADYVDNDPEFLVGVSGMDNPLCFNTEGTTDQVVRLVQDPSSGIIVNARIFYDSLTNKTFIGAIMIAQGSFRVIGKQRVVMVNNTKFDWGELKTMNIDGNRVVIRENMVAVTFKQRRITLVIQRHFANRDDFVDYAAIDKETPGRPSAGNNSDISDITRTGANIIPVIGFEQQESLINHFLSAKRRRSLLLQKFFGLNHDRAVVRNLLIEFDSEGRKKRNKRIPEDSTEKQLDAVVANVANIQENQQPEKKKQPTIKQQKKDEEEKDQHIREKNIKTDEKNTQTREKNTQLHQSSRARGSKALFQKQRRRQHHFHRRRRYILTRHKREDDDNEMEGGVEKRREKTTYLGIYIADSRDFSNKTHGLLGQFLFKNITREKIRYRNGRMRARLLVHGNPSRRTIALLTLRRNMALNATKTCWKIRNQGRDVLDGRYSDYLIPNLRYSSLKELPPPPWL